MAIDTSNIVEHSLPIIRRDFITASHCAFCRKKLPSGIALILNHPTLGELPAGTYCGPHWGRAPDNGFPDFTKIGLLETPPIGGEGHHPGKPSYKPDREYQRNVAYLLLRAEKLPAQGFVGLEFPMITRFHEIFLEKHGLSPDQSQKLSRFIDSPNVRSSKFSYYAFMLAYTHSYWLNQCLEKGRQKLRPHNYARLESFRAQLLEKWTLSAKQIECLNSDLDFILKDRSPRLDPNAFAPYRPQHKPTPDTPRSPHPGEK
jgi:hypothetical protein